MMDDGDREREKGVEKERESERECITGSLH